MLAAACKRSAQGGGQFAALPRAVQNQEIEETRFLPSFLNLEEPLRVPCRFEKPDAFNQVGLVGRLVPLDTAQPAILLGTPWGDRRRPRREARTLPGCPMPTAKSLGSWRVLLPEEAAEKVARQRDVEPRFFAHEGEEKAVASIADHLVKFWDPRMRETIQAHLAAGGGGLDPLVLRAVRRLKKTTAQTPDRPSVV